MALQGRIYDSLNESLTGIVEKVIIDSRTDSGYIGRGEHSTPMADPKIFISSERDLCIGDFYDVRITGSRGKDMNGELIV